MNTNIEIKKDMVFESTGNSYPKYFIPQELSDNYWYGLNLDKNFNIIGYDDHSKEMLLNDKGYYKLAEKTLDTLWAGDILALGDDRYKKIIQRIGNIVYITTTTNFIGDLVEYDSVYDTASIQEIKYSGYQLVVEEKEIKEVTMEEVCQKFGETIKIKK